MSSIKEFRVPLDDIKLATNNFSSENFIGLGGFGKVYKGELSHSEGKIKVAVKRLDPERRFGQGQRTFGYCDPLYIETGILTKESDVYSLGVVLFEVLCGRFGMENYNDGRRFLARLAQQSYEENKLDDIIDNNLKKQMDPTSLATFSAIAYRCLLKDRDERPTMFEIVKELETALEFQEKRDANVVNTESYRVDLLDAQTVLSAFKQYRLRVIAEVPVAGLSHSTYRCIRSIEFDKDGELFATAGASKCIKIFDYAKIVNESVQVHDPVVEISTSSAVNCLSWNKDAKNHLASIDNKGIVTVWDVNSQQVVMEYKEHKKRVWSVDYSIMEPSMLVSGGNDCKVKVWSPKHEASCINIDMKSPVCCVKYHPGSSVHIAVACQNDHSYYYDLRNTSAPLRIFIGHQKPVSYVKFLSNNELATASTDNTLKLWDLNQNLPVRTFKGHTNVRNFVGLSVFNDFMACGSETNEVFAYHKTISKPLTWQQLADDEDFKSPFVSAVCWKSDSPVMIADNSKGDVRVLVLET